MRLTDIFQNHTIRPDAAEPGRALQETPRALSGEAKPLVPGQTVQAEILARSGDELQLKLAGDILLQAKVDAAVNLETGQNLFFQVKTAGKQLLLSPLFTNTATQETVYKALDMASLPINEKTVAMTGKMMEAGLPIDKNALQTVFRQMNTFTEIPVQDIVDLHKLGLPVNESSVNQIAAYKNFSHQLLAGMDEILSLLPETMDGLLKEGAAQDAADLYTQLLETALEAQETAQPATQTPGETPVLEGQKAPDTGEVPQGAAAQPGTGAPLVEAEPQTKVPHRLDAAMAAQTPAGEQTPPAGVPKQVIAETPLQEGVLVREAADDPERALREPGAEVTAKIQELIRDESVPMEQKLAQIRETLTQEINGGREETAAKLLKNETVQGLLKDQLRNLFTTTPKELEDHKRIEELYQRVDRQLKGMMRSLESVGKDDTPVYKAVSNMNQNVDFLHQINQVYTYVQLPLRNQQGDAHGDLYVYTNKKSLAENNGQVSALLHLDMEYLGPVDVYVTLQEQKVNTNFTVRDDEMLDFLEQHMDLLTQRLQKRGYNLTANMQVRQDAPEGKRQLGALEALAPQEEGSRSILQNLSFDVRA